ECGAHRGLTRRGGRAAPGARVAEGTPGPSGARSPVVADPGPEGVRAPRRIEGATDAVAFAADVERILAPSLRPGDVALRDNRSADTGDAVRAAIRGRAAGLVDSPPDSPDLNPIETCWSKVKAALRAAEARTLAALLEALCAALRAVRRRVR